MAGDWIRSKLGDVIAVNPIRPLVKGSGSVYISMQQVEAGSRSVSEIDRRAFNGSGARFQKGDTLFARITPCLENGKTAYVNFLEKTEIGHGSTEFSVLSGIKGISDDLFVYYLARYPEFRNFAIARMEGSSGRQRVPAPTLKDYEFACPPYDEQRAIAHILGSLDDKIESNRQMNGTLEAMAGAIFKSWFVDFDPVRAKAEGRDTGLPGEIAELFPDSFEGSVIGEIPRGWEVMTIGQAVKCVGGSTPNTKNPAFWGGGKNPFVTPKDMSSLTSPIIQDTSRHITDVGVDKISSGRLPIGTVILSSRAPIGYLAITEVPVSVNQGVIAMICNKDLPNYYVLCWAETNMETIKSNAGGTTFAEISKGNFRPIPVVVPHKFVLDTFVQQVVPLHKQIVLNLQESKSLASLRDTVLPKLISGELRVPDAEKFLEEAGV